MLKLPSPSVMRGPEFAGDLDHGLHLGAVDFHCVDAGAAGFQRVEIRLAVQVLVDLAPGVPEAHELVVILRDNRCAQLRSALHDLERRALAQHAGQSVSTASSKARSVSPRRTSNGRIW